MARKFDESGGSILSSERKIKWLASYPKSGNTWVRMFLEAYATQMPINLNSGYQFVTSDLRPELYQMAMPRPLSELSLTEQFMYHGAALLNLLKMTPHQHTYVKTHNARAVIDSYPLIPPQISGASVYILRDPRDIVISMSHHFDKTIDEAIEQLGDGQRAGAANFNLHHMFMSWSLHIHSWLIDNKVVPILAVRYEDLLNHSEKAFKAILEQFDIEYDEQRFHFALKESSFDSLHRKEGDQGFVEKAGGDRFFRVGKSGQWKEILTAKQIDKIESDHKEVMKKYGYL